MEFTDEEDISDQGSPAKDLGSAYVIGALALAVLLMSLQLDSPDSTSTAPGLMPFVISLSLLFMALLLGFKAVQAGGARAFARGFRQAIETWFASEEERRAMLLLTIIVGYIALVGSISFEWQLPTSLFVFRFSSYELISILVVTLMMKLFWQASLVRCFLISLLTVEVLAAIFRYGFGVVMPESF